MAVIKALAVYMAVVWTNISEKHLRWMVTTSSVLYGLYALENGDNGKWPPTHYLWTTREESKNASTVSYKQITDKPADLINYDTTYDRMDTWKSP